MVKTSVLRCWDFRDSSKKLILCPAMNTGMWDHPVTDKNLNIIKTFSKEIVIIPPIKKTLICGDTGIGAMEEVDKIVEIVAGNSQEIY